MPRYACRCAVSGASEAVQEGPTSILAPSPQPFHLSPLSNNVWPRQGKDRQEGCEPLRQGGPPVPGGPRGALPEAGQVRHPRRRRRARVPGRRAGVPGRRGAGAGRQRQPRQQEDAVRLPCFRAQGFVRRSLRRALTPPPAAASCRATSSWPSATTRSCPSCSARVRQACKGGSFAFQSKSGLAAPPAARAQASAARRLARRGQGGPRRDLRVFSSDRRPRRAPSCAVRLP